MKKAVMLLGLITQLLSGKTQKYDYSQYPVYHGDDLGLKYSTEKSLFRIWAPSARYVQLLVYEKADGGDPMHTIRMLKSIKGTWTAEMKGDHKWKYYAFRVQMPTKTVGGEGEWLNEVPDPYAKAVGVNGKRAMIINMDENSPPGWRKDKSPPSPFTSRKGVQNNRDELEATDAIIYELHIRDASIAANSGIRNKGKFLGLTERGTRNNEGLSTGLDHLKELGVTHIHLLPSFDFNSVDESKPGDAQYNWGYDPLNYNVPEGSYSSDAFDATRRIFEFKQLVKTFHDNGFRVVMDVVYNHTALTETSNFNQLVPGYYYRHTADGKFSNATACGNETASERAMMRKFILESMKYWVEEYHIDGFRVDLMGVHDIETMNLVSRELQKLKPDILLYGEGWTAGPSTLPDSVRALKKYAYKLDRIAVFSDDIRDGIKGHVFTPSDKGFASGKEGMEESIKFGVVAACPHPQVNYSKVNYSREPFAAHPYHTVTYAECHDNHILWDKLTISAPNTTEAQRKEMHKLALTIVLTSQGLSFLHAGCEFLRSKKGVENSFQSPDSINAINWELKTRNKDVFEYIRSLIRMRKEHPAFRLRTGKEIADHIRFHENLPAGMVAFTIDGAAVNDSWKKICVIFNGNGKFMPLFQSFSDWKMFAGDNQVPGAMGSIDGKVMIAPYSSAIFYQ